MTKIEEKINFFFKYRVGFLPKILLPRAKVYFYPQPPHQRTIIFKVFKQLGIKVITNFNNDFDFAFFWDDKTFSDDTTFPELQTKNLNRFCTDISKKKVDEIFAKVFGYYLSVDPLTYNGKCVIKSNENAQHDGRVVNCPVERLGKNVVYQKVIDNQFDENSVVDYRIPIIGNEIPLVYYKFKTLDKRFTNDVHHAELHNIEEVLSEEEISNILNFAKEINLDYGELDVLRNKDDNKIYIVDVNKTPWGPPATLPKKDCEAAIEKMSDAFEKVFC